MFRILVRSSRDTMRQYCVDTLEACFSMAGMKVTTDGAPRLATFAGKRDRDAHGTGLQRPLRRRAKGTKSVHAGLECSVILSHCPGMDVVSFGPTLQSPHTPNERCFIPSVEKYWRLVLETLARTPKK